MGVSQIILKDGLPKIISAKILMQCFSHNMPKFAEKMGRYVELLNAMWLQLNFELILIYNQRLSRACIVHLVIKKTNWSFVKTMSCVILELRST